MTGAIVWIPEELPPLYALSRYACCVTEKKNVNPFGPPPFVVAFSIYETPPEPVHRIHIMQVNVPLSPKATNVLSAVVKRFVATNSPAAVPSILVVVLLAIAPPSSARFRPVAPCAFTRVPDASSSIHAPVIAATQDGDATAVTGPPTRKVDAGPSPCLAGPPQARVEASTSNQTSQTPTANRSGLVRAS